MEEKDYYVPSHLDDQPRMLFWEVDEFLAMCVPLGIGIVIDFIFLGAIGGLFAAYGVNKIKAGYGRAIILHTIYWNMPSDILFKMKRTPPSHIREFIG